VQANATPQGAREYVNNPAAPIPDHPLKRMLDFCCRRSRGSLVMWLRRVFIALIVVELAMAAGLSLGAPVMPYDREYATAVANWTREPTATHQRQLESARQRFQGTVKRHQRMRQFCFAVNTLALFGVGWVCTPRG
jgi:hypothetical protein